MILPSKLFAQSIGQRKIYLFSTKKINSSIPHFFICLKKTSNELLIMCCCTSKVGTIERFISSRSLPKETIVKIEPIAGENSFSVNTYVNCNNIFVYTVAELESKYNKSELDLKGEISETIYEQIIVGLKSSPLVDEETKDFFN